MGFYQAKQPFSAQDKISYFLAFVNSLFKDEKKLFRHLFIVKKVTISKTVLVKEMDIQKQYPKTCVLNTQIWGDRENMRFERISLI